MPGALLCEFRTRPRQRLAQLLGARLVTGHIGLATRRLAQRPIEPRLLRRSLGLGGTRETLERRALALPARLQHERAQQQAEQESRRCDEQVIRVGNDGMHCASGMAMVLGRLYEPVMTLSL